MSKLLKPRRNEGKLDLQLTIKDGKVNLLAKEGHTPILKLKDKKFQNLNEVLEMMNQKLN